MKGDILIIVATAMEIAPFLARVTAIEHHCTPLGHALITARQEDIFFQVLITGPGMVNTALALGGVLARHTPRLMMQTGIAGFFPDHGLQPGSIAVAATELDVHSRVESTDGHLPLPFPLCGSPVAGHDGQLAMHPGLIRAALKILSAPACRVWANGDTFDAAGLPFMALPDTPVVAGPFITVSTITSTRETVRHLAHTYTPVMEAMEGAASALTAARCRIPFLEIRAASNPVGVRDKAHWNIPLATHGTAVALNALLKKGDRLWHAIPRPAAC